MTDLETKKIALCAEGEEKMSIMNIVLLVISLVMFVYGLYLWGRILIPKWTEKDIFFSSPKLGRIKARKRSGRIMGFFDNIVRKGKHVNKETGEIEVGEIKTKGFWWSLFGVYFIGLDEIYKYKIAVEAQEDNKGELYYSEKEASSIFLEGSYPLTATFVTKDGVRLKIKLQLKLTTVDAAKALSLPVSWTIPVFASVLGASRDFFGSRSIINLITTQNEGKIIKVDINNVKNSDFVEQILGLNIHKVGNVPLGDICGQYIDAVNLVDIDFADEETKKAFSAPFIAEQEAQKQVKEALAYANAIKIKSEADMLAATSVAAAITLKGDAEAEIYKKKHLGLGSDSKAAAQVITAEKHSEMKNLTTLVNGSNSVVSIPTSEKVGENK